MFGRRTRRSAGSSFHNRGLAAVKLLSPNRLCVLKTKRYGLRRRQWLRLTFGRWAAALASKRKLGRTAGYALFKTAAQLVEVQYQASSTLSL